jgi:hypothetical protein
MNQPHPDPTACSIDFDHPPVAEIEFEGARYRVDVGLGTAVAVSRRAPGSWSWQLLAEGRWDGVRLKAKQLDRLVVEALAQALRSAADEMDRS